MPLKPYGYFMQSTNLLFLLIIYSLPDNTYSVTKYNHKKFYMVNIMSIEAREATLICHESLAPKALSLFLNKIDLLR